jgi:roadblock/LC7 domain-containing protein
MTANANLSLPMSAQADLLSYFGQQLIAHGAVLFAILTAAFTFMGRMRPKNQYLRRAAIYITIAGFLIGAGLYTLCRMLWYGALVDSVIRTPSSASKDLWSYFLVIVANAKIALGSRGFPYPFIALFSTSLNYGPPLFVCFCAGFSIAFFVFLIEPVGGRTGYHWVPTYNWLILVLCILTAALTVLGITLAR